MEQRGVQYNNMAYSLFRTRTDPNKVYLQLDNPSGTSQYSVSPEILSQLGLNQNEVQTYATNPLYYYQGDLTSSKQLTNAFKGYQIVGGGQTYKGGDFTGGYAAEAPSWLMKYFSTPTDFNTTTASQFNLAAPQQPTDFELAYKQGQASGLSSDQIKQQYAVQQQTTNPQNYPATDTKSFVDSTNQSINNINNINKNQPQTTFSTPQVYGSIVDYLKNKGVPSDFDYRKRLFESLGLNPKNGTEFRGYAEENLALLNYLSKAEKNSGVSLSLNNMGDILSIAQKDSSINTNSSNQPQQSNNSDEKFTAPPGYSMEYLSGDDKSSSSNNIEGMELPSSILEMLYGKQYSADELSQMALDKFTGSATYGLKQEESESNKAALQLQAQADKESFIKKIASQGLIFSGAKKTGLASIDADAIAKQFGIDRKFALYVAQGLESAAQDIAKEASKGNADALASLRSLGYDVNPLTGRIEQTQTAKNASATQARFEETQKRLETNTAETQRIAQERLDISKAKANKEDVVGWSQWAAERGLVGASIEQAQEVALKEAQDEKMATRNRELSSVRTNIFDYINKVKAKEKNLPTREQLLEQLIAQHKTITKEEIATELYGLTKVLEK
jgi:hypothetical protein